MITVIEVKNGTDKTLSEFEKAAIKLAVDAVVTGTGNFLADKLVQPLGTDTTTARPDGSIVTDNGGGQNENAVPQSEKRRSQVRLRIDRVRRVTLSASDRELLTSLGGVPRQVAGHSEAGSQTCDCGDHFFSSRYQSKQATRVGMSFCIPNQPSPFPILIPNSHSATGEFRLRRVRAIRATIGIGGN